MWSIPVTMADAASVLLGFPGSAPNITLRQYDEAVKDFIKKIEELLVTQRDAVAGDNAVQLLKVR